MKRFSFLLGLTFLFISLNAANAIEFDVTVESSSGATFVHPDDGQTYYKANIKDGPAPNCPDWE